MSKAPNSSNDRRAVGTAYLVVSLLLLAILLITFFTVTASIARRREENPPATPQTAQTTTAPEPPSTTAAQPSLREEPETTSPPSTAPDVERMETPPITTAQTQPVIEQKPARRYAAPTVGRISKDFSADSLVFSLTMNDYRTHNGIDISAPTGTAVCAFADGVIEAVFTDDFYGGCIRIDHGNGLKSCYRNLSDELPEDIFDGAEVICGQVIAGVGESAICELADSTHLHFELTENGRYIDPAQYIELEMTGEPYEDE